MTGTARRVWKRLPIPVPVRRAVRVVRLQGWRLARAHQAVVYRRYEDLEVSRARRLLGGAPAAEVVTVIAAYRRPDGLLTAVRSALDQTVTDHLVCVVDDGGGLPDLPDDPRLVSVTLSRNYGCLGMVRNVGIRVTDSRYLAFLDDDNAWTPDHLELSLAAHAAGAEVTYTALHRVFPNGSTLDVLSVPFDRKSMWLRSYTDSNALVLRRGPGVFFSRIPKLKEDFFLVMSLSRRQRVVHIPVPTVRYLVNPESRYTNWAAVEPSR